VARAPGTGPGATGAAARPRQGERLANADHGEAGCAATARRELYRGAAGREPPVGAGGGVARAPLS